MSLSSTAIAAKAAEETAAAIADLILIGTVVAGDDSLALIQSGTKAGIFQLQEELAPGVFVSQIGRKFVILMDHGVPASCS